MQDPKSAAAARNKRQILDHFEALINNKDLGAINRNLGAEFYDHDGPGGRPDAAAEKPMIAAAKGYLLSRASAAFMALLRR